MKSLGTYLILTFVIAFCAGCGTQSGVVRGQPQGLNRTPSDLDQNGFFQSGWWVAIHDGDVFDWPARVIADANAEANARIAQLSLPGPLGRPEVHIVPDVSGYEVVILSRARLTTTDTETIRKAVDGAVSAAHEKWQRQLARDRMEGNVGPNKSPEPTPGRVTPAARAPGAPPPSAAQL